MPLFDYSVFHNVAVTLSRTTLDVPNGGLAHSLNVNLPGSTPETVVAIRRNRGGVLRGSHEIELAVKPQVGGTGAGGGLFLCLQTAIGNKDFTRDPRDQKAYVLEFDPNLIDLVHLKDGMLPTSKILFTGNGMTLGSIAPCGPGNWFHMLMQLQVFDDLTAVLRIRKSASHMDAGSPVWSRITNLPDIDFTVSEALDPGWFGVWARGTTGDLMRFNSIKGRNQLTSI